MLTYLSIQGFKSIERLEGFEPGRINVLIGANGAGKSNLLSFFRMLGFSLSNGDGLRGYVGMQGGASKLLFGGVGRSRVIDARLRFKGTKEDSFNEYAFSLAHAAEDSFIFTNEEFRYRSDGANHPAPGLGAGHNEPKLVNAALTNATAKHITQALRRIIYHQFHNTSSTSRMRDKWREDDNRHLKEDGGNLAPFLLRIRELAPQYYRIIRDSVRRLLPFFDDFVLEPDYGHILLRWKERGSDVVFGASQASDGMLRLFALVALLQQPPEGLANVLILDEPELGLHPAGIELLGGLIRSASVQTQFFIATQSPHLVDCFEPEDVIVVERKDGASTFTRHSSEELEVWLEEYSMGDIWRMNLVGGRP
ncbi:MAG: AAA family ATPase [Bryobacter sp.]|nr:AAA family ATPase [Bryobacter sp.]